MNELFIEKKYVTSIERGLETPSALLSKKLPPEKIQSETKWATQATLAKHFDMSKSTICRYLKAGIIEGKITPYQFSLNGKKGRLRYKMDAVENYFISTVENPNLI